MVQLVLFAVEFEHDQAGDLGLCQSNPPPTFLLSENSLFNRGFITTGDPKLRKFYAAPAKRLYRHAITIKAHFWVAAMVDEGNTN
jgi:hypothetical protein